MPRSARSSSSAHAVARRAFWIAHAAQIARIHSRGHIDAGAGDWGEHGSVHRREYRAAEAAELSEGGGIGGAAPDRSGRARAGGFRKWPAALAVNVLHVLRTQPHISIAGCVDYGHGERDRAGRAGTDTDGRIERRRT